MASYSSKQHIAHSGVKAGQWVKCIATGSCRLGGAHVEERTLKEVQEWAGRRAWIDMTQKDYEDYLQSKIAGTLDSTKRPMETLEEKKERLGGAERVTKDPATRKMQPGTKLRETQKLKGTLPEEEYYAKLFEDYAEINNLPLKDQKRIEKLLDEKFDNGRYGQDYTKKAAALKTWIKNDHINNLDRLSTYVKKETKSRNSNDGNAVVRQLLDQVEANSRRSNVTATQVSRIPAGAVPLVPSSKPRTYASSAPVANRIPDYKTLNDDSPATQAVLKQLQSYEIPGQGAFGAKTKEDKLVEYMVRNQLVFKGKVNDYSFEKIPATEYASRLDVQVSHNYGIIPKIIAEEKYDRMKGGSLKLMKNKLEKVVDQDNNHQKMQKSIHDSFVQASKTELLTLLVGKGHDDSEYVAKVASATKASEIYSLQAVVRELKHQDEFSRAGL